MRHKFYIGLLLIFFLVNTNLFAQNFWVPDAYFRTKLKLLYPSCFTAQDSMITTCIQIQSETYLKVSSLGINTLDGLQFFTSLDTLDCGGNNLTNLPALPSSLIYLSCHGNQLSSLPPLPASLTNLYCSNNQLSSLPTLPASLTILDCGENYLTSLPALPASLSLVYCYENQLSNLPVLPTSLFFFDCNQNQLLSLPALPDSLVFLSCRNNQLTSLPALPASLTYLYCHSNQLTSLPPLPDTLRHLNCNQNQLTSLPVLPDSLVTLTCNQNQLTSLPVLPVSLTSLECFYNQLTSLPALPTSLIALYCHNNQLTSLPKIPGKTISLNCSNNPITCFPEIAPHPAGNQSWLSINFISTLITCIPHLETVPHWLVQSSQTLPICTPYNTACNYNFTVGYVFLDANANGIKDTMEQGLEIPVFYSGNSGMFPDSSGIFHATSDTGNISFQLTVPQYYTATNPSSQAIQVVSGIVDTLYFGLQPIPNISDLQVDLSSIGFLRPGFKAKYQLHYQNVGTDTLYNVHVKFLKPSQLANLSTVPIATLLNADTLIWNIASLVPYQQGDIVITDSVFANAVLGDTASALAWIEPLAGDTTPLNNNAVSLNLISSFFGYLNKSVSPEEVLPNATGYLVYIIRFHNIMSDTAFAVMIEDKLSPLLDLNSIQMISASHPYYLWVENRVVKWDFKNLLLPFSNINEAESHGFVKFRIKPLPGLTESDSISNKAFFYFNYNILGITNTIVVNVNLVHVKELKQSEFKIFPNPVQESLRIVNQHAGPLGKIELINANGKVLETKTISSSTFTWNLQHLPAGTYILKGLGWGQKVVKE